MSRMCQLCGLEQTTPENDDLQKIVYCKECEQRITTSSSNGEYPLCDASKKDCSSPYIAPLICLTLSSSSYGSCVSTFDDIQVNTNEDTRDYGIDGLDTGQSNYSPKVTEPLVEHAKGNLFKDNRRRCPVASDYVSELASPMPVENHQSNSLASEDIIGIETDKTERDTTILEEGQSPITGDYSDVRENAVVKSILTNDEGHIHIWIPPEPEDIEHDRDSVANNDDDDYCDGTSWGQPSSLSSLDEELGNHLSYKEERQKAMMEAMNGQFKILVSRLLATEGLSLSGKGNDNWLDIVTSLSWEAALFIKPDADEGRAMDPVSYVKVKCIASGSRSQSQVIKGLVFKKNTAHKHMLTKLRSPRLLLLKGSVGHSVVGLSSLASVNQEDDYEKSFLDMIDSCSPNVVLMEKTVSRDIQGSLFERGISLVLDMKLPRLERIARCTGSAIISSADMSARPKLKQCDTFRVEKFVEEHNCAGEGGKTPAKTLLFLEGCPRPHGCTILLKGAHVNELKKVKRVVHFTVFAAYHLILETLFFSDQRTFFYDVNAVKEVNGIPEPEPVASLSDAFSIEDNSNGALAGISPVYTLDVPIADGSVEKPVDGEMKFSPDQDSGGSFMMPRSTTLLANTAARNNKVSLDQIYEKSDNDETILSDSSVQTLATGQLLSAVSVSLRKFLRQNIPPLTIDSISSYLSFDGKISNTDNTSPVISPQPETFNPRRQADAIIKHEEPDSGCSHDEKVGVESDHNRTTEHCSEQNTTEVRIEGKDDIESALNSQSILVLLSTYCIPKHMVCEQIHFSRITYYGNLDVSLGRYLQDMLLSQNHSCSACGQPPEDHIYYYTHQNGNLTVRVRHIPREFALSGEAEGKIWMWTHCLKCEHERRTLKPTRRVVMSSAARGLSFGKFLELSFSSHSAASRLSRCGHLLHRDCLRFFGLGCKVAMFMYTSLEIYTACKPPPRLELCNPYEQEWFIREARDVLSRGDFLFKETADLLKKLKPKFSSGLIKHSANISGSVLEFDEVEKMFTCDKSEFEGSLLKAINHSLHLSKSDHVIVDLNWLTQELLLMLYVWDCRLRNIFVHTTDGETFHDAANEQLHKENEVIACNKFLEGNKLDGGDKGLEVPIQIDTEPKDLSFSGCHEAETHAGLETKLETELSEVSNEGSPNSSESFPQERSYVVECASFTCNKSGEEVCKPTGEDHRDHMQEDNSVPVLVGPLEPVEKAFGLETEVDRVVNVHETGPKSEDFKLEDPEWIWFPFNKLRKILRQDLCGGFLQKFEFVNTYCPTHLSPMPQLATEVKDSLHFPIGPGGGVISVIEDEISSIIACALALSDENSVSGKTSGNEAMNNKGETVNAVSNSLSLTSNSQVLLPNQSPTEASNADRMKSSWSFSSLSSEELAIFGSGGLLFADGLTALGNLHPEIPVGSGKLAGKSKYSVVCIYAKQFYSLRRKVCTAEMAYISSLRRCRKWDAQGGKSKVVFAKTLDDRFIIKQIKKPELESFLKFGPDYFKYINISLDSGSQTCLAKILGIYQVRQNKNGKEIKTDVAVMENLFYGRNIYRKYDLKGAVFSRYISNSNDTECVFLDENFVEDMHTSPIYIGGRNKHLLQSAILNDTSFLTSINVMDYSLLVGVDKKKHEIVFGIIDYLRQYTWDKQLETWVKASLVVPKNELPTVISPKEYQRRFRKFMERYFLTVPDNGSSQQSSGCNCGSDGSSSCDSHNAKL